MLGNIGVSAISIINFDSKGNHQSCSFLVWYKIDIATDSISDYLWAAEAYAYAIIFDLQAVLDLKIVPELTKNFEKIWNPFPLYPYSVIHDPGLKNHLVRQILVRIF